MKLKIITLLILTGTSFGLQCGIQKVENGTVIYTSKLTEVNKYVYLTLEDLLNSDKIVGRIVGDPESLQLEIEHVESGWTTIGKGEPNQTINLINGNTRYIMGCI